MVTGTIIYLLLAVPFWFWAVSIERRRVIKARKRDAAVGTAMMALLWLPVIVIPAILFYWADIMTFVPRKSKKELL